MIEFKNWMLNNKRRQKIQPHIIIESYLTPLEAIIHVIMFFEGLDTYIVI